MRLLAALTAAAALAGAADAGAVQTGCFGPPADYLAEFDTVRGQTNNGRVNYPEPRVFLEVQGHIAKNDGNARAINEREHIHIGACFPEGETWAQPNDARRLDFRFVFHHVVDYDLSHIEGRWVDATGTTTGGDTLPATAGQLAELNQAMDNSASGTATVFQTYRMGPAKTNGLKQLRMVVQIAEANTNAAVGLWFVETFWWSRFNYDGLGPPVPGVPVQNLPKVAARNWFEQQDGQVSYHYGGFPSTVPGWPLEPPVNTVWNYRNLRALRPCNWRVTVDGTDGTNNVLLAVDPNFHGHHDDLGAWHHAEYGQLRDRMVTVTVPVCQLGFASRSVHRLVYLAESLPETVPHARPVSAAVLVVPFRVP